MEMIKKACGIKKVQAMPELLKLLHYQLKIKRNR